MLCTVAKTIQNRLSLEGNKMADRRHRQPLPPNAVKRPKATIDSRQSDEVEVRNCRTAVLWYYFADL
jgi:hypothetical protein